MYGLGGISIWLVRCVLVMCVSCVWPVRFAVFFWCVVCVGGDVWVVFDVWSLWYEFGVWCVLVMRVLVMLCVGYVWYACSVRW